MSLNIGNEYRKLLELLLIAPIETISMYSSVSNFVTMFEYLLI